jgi:hypothetical protein
MRICCKAVTGAEVTCTGVSIVILRGRDVRV